MLVLGQLTLVQSQLTLVPSELRQLLRQWTWARSERRHRQGDLLLVLGQLMLVLG